MRMVAEVKAEYPSECAAIGAVAQKLGIGSSETPRKWIRQVDVDGGTRSGVPREDCAEIQRLKRGVAELRRANEILVAASFFFAANRARCTGRVRRSPQRCHAVPAEDSGRTESSSWPARAGRLASWSAVTQGRWSPGRRSAGARIREVGWLTS